MFFLPLPLPFSPATQSSLFLHSMCPNHLNLPSRTKSNTHSIPNRPNNSSFVLLSFNVTPHIHLTIILFALSSQNSERLRSKISGIGWGQPGSTWKRAVKLVVCVLCILQ